MLDDINLPSSLEGSVGKGHLFLTTRNFCSFVFPLQCPSVLDSTHTSLALLVFLTVPVYLILLYRSVIQDCEQHKSKWDLCMGVYVHVSMCV